MRKNLWSSIYLIVIFALLVSGCSTLAMLKVHPKTYQELHFAKTEDDWTLELQRYYQKGHVQYKEPIILCHGMGYNSNFWAIDDKRSLAQYLADQGFDVWAVSLRGSGKSSKTGWFAFREILSVRFNDFTNVSMSADKLDWNIEDHIEKDIPALISKVQEVSGAESVNWVGHSMGSVIVFGFLELAENPEVIRNVVAISPPFTFLRPHNKMLSFLETHPYYIDLNLLVNQKNLYQFLVPLRGIFKDPLGDLFFKNKNMDEETIIRLYDDVVENISPGVAGQFRAMLKKGDFVSADGEMNYTENLDKVTLPVLLLVGRDDDLTPPETVRYGYRKLASRDKTYLEFSTLEGYSTDYGHDDLVIGKNVYNEVYPKISGWLKLRSK